jgi:F420-0:gamma-glutamyl ligase-like protein
MAIEARKNPEGQGRQGDDHHPLTFKFKVIRSEYWLPGSDAAALLSKLLADKIREHDIVIISEKALSVISGRIVDESDMRPSITARFLARVWMRLLWGYLLGKLCRLRRETIANLRRYPIVEGSKHKQLILQAAGPLQALRHVSEGGVDVTNLPLSYAALPLEDPDDTAANIASALQSRLKLRVGILITDTDMTYSFRSFHVTPLRKACHGILAWGFPAYMIGRILKLKARATPVGNCGVDLPINQLLDLADAAHHLRGSGAGRTIWDMARRFRSNPTQVTWDMLRGIEHKPVVIARRVTAGPEAVSGMGLAFRRSLQLKVSGR